jgi:hypothetical protein
MIPQGAAVSAGGVPPRLLKGCKKQKCEFIHVVEHNEFPVDSMAGKSLAFFRRLPAFFPPTISMRPGYRASGAR